MIIALLLVTATFQPAQPTVGDPIRIEFSEPVTIDPPPHVEVLSRQGKRVVVRTFRPEPFEIAGVKIPVRSVLAPDDRLEPAPLKPPVELPASRVPWIAIASAAAAAALFWIAAVALARRAARRSIVVPPLPAAEQFRRAVVALRDDPRLPQRWAALADATRRYLAVEHPDLGLELTTRELLQRNSHPPLAEILHLGDLEKFSPWGAPPRDFDSVADRALSLIPPPPRAEEQEAA